MSFANPSAQFWALLAVPVVVFYVLKTRLRRVPVSTTLFWRQIFDEKKPRSLWQKLRHLLSLLAQLLLLGSMVAALAEPFFGWEAKTARRIVLVLDASASMSATDGGTTRFARAADEARRVIAGLTARDEMAIVVVGSPPRVACGVTGHQRTLRDALAAIELTDGPTALAEAVAVARRLVAESGGEGGRVVVVTDGCGPQLPPADDLAVIAVGTKVGNVGITRFQVRRSAIDPIGYEILVEVANKADEPAPADLRLVLALNGRVVDVKPLKLAANATWSDVIENTTADGGRLTAELVVKGDRGDKPFVDALAADNTAVAVLPKRDPIPVHLHSPTGNLFLQKVLEANPLARVTTSKEMPKAFPPGGVGVTVFHRELPPTLPPGPVLVVDPANGCDLWAVGDKLANPLVTQQDKESPLMAHVRLDNVLMPEARRLSFTPAAGKPQVLAGSVTGEPLFALLDRPAGKVAVLTVNLDLGDLPFRTAFPILAMNALAAFTSGPGDLREALPTGATAEVTTTAGAVLRSPAGVEKPLPAGAKLTVGPFDRCGVWAVGADEFAVNLMSPAESDLRPPAGVTATTATEVGLGGGWFGRPTWWYAIGVAFALAAVEWGLYQRRWIS